MDNTNPNAFTLRRFRPRPVRNSDVKPDSSKVLVRRTLERVAEERELRELFDYLK